jgi:hypothetical protein
VSARFPGLFRGLRSEPSKFGPKFAVGGGQTSRAVSPHPPEGAQAVGAARCGRAEVLEGRKVTSDVHNSNSADRFHSVLGVFGFFCAA